LRTSRESEYFRAANGARKFGRHYEIMLTDLRRLARAKFDQFFLPASATLERTRDRHGLPPQDPGIEAVESAVLEWLCAAQDLSASHDGGTSRHFSPVSGWAPSYPETSGYIVPTLIAAGIRRGDVTLLNRARRIAEWLKILQFPEGGFQGGTIGAKACGPVTFNTGQILLGLAAATRQFGSEYETPMHRAADWLVNTIDADGCWRKFPTPFAAPGEKAYETHVAWGLLEAARSSRDPGAAQTYTDIALRNARWAISKQHDNGWFDCCCLELPESPLTHTIGYVLRGLTEVYLQTRDDHVLTAVLSTADALVLCVGPDGFLPGRLDRHWHGTVEWACITGSAQIAHSLLLLFTETGRLKYKEAAFAMSHYARRTVRLDGPVGIRGGVKGSFPIDGEYGRYEFLSWAAKFLIDAGDAERSVRAQPSGRSSINHMPARRLRGTAAELPERT